MTRSALHQRSRSPSPVIVPCLLLIAAIAGVYWDTWSGLVRQWANDDNYAHGFLMLPLASYFAWQRRRLLRSAPVAPSFLGLVTVGAGALLYLLGTAAAEVFISRISLLFIIAGSILFLFGREHLRLLSFPLVLLLFMIPLPAIVFNQIAFPLQLFASEVGELALRAAGVPVVRDGNVLELVSMRLEVAEACSGIRSLASLLTFAVVLGHMSGCSGAGKLLLAIATLPIAIGANAARVTGLGLAAHVWGRSGAEGLLHGASGVMVFAVAISALLLVNHAIRARCASVEC